MVVAIMTGTHCLAVANSLEEEDKATTTNDDDETTPVLFSHRISVTQSLPHLSVEQAYHHCLYAWRYDNLGLPWYLSLSTFGISAPRIEAWGDERTGQGLILHRVVPPVREGIVNVEWVYDDDDDNSQEEGQQQQQEKEEQDYEALPKSVRVLTRATLQYKVLNPSYTTWPLQDHFGTVVFVAAAKDNNNNNNHGGGSHMTWTIEWTPLWMPLPGWNTVLTWIHTLIATSMTRYMMMVPNKDDHHQDEL